MAKTTTISIRTDSTIKAQAQAFFDSLWLSLTSWINLLLADVAKNKKLKIDIQPLVLHEVAYDTLSEEMKSSIQEVDQMDDHDFIMLDLTDDDSVDSYFSQTHELPETKKPSQTV